MKAVDKVIRVVCIPYVDEKPKRHTWYLYNAKVGTGPHVLIWVADRPELHPGDYGFTFIDAFKFDMSDKSKWVKYPSPSEVTTGQATDENSFLVFVSKT